MCSLEERLPSQHLLKPLLNGRRDRPPFAKCRCMYLRRLVPLAGLEPARPCGHLILSQTHMTVAGRTSALVHSAVHRNEVLNVSASDIAETSAPWPFHPREQISPRIDARPHL